MGFINLNTGVPKYVFTQAAAPSGEGEVEGALWYNTTLNRLETYTGAAWTEVSSGDGGVNAGLIFPMLNAVVTAGLLKSLFSAFSLSTVNPENKLSFRVLFAAISNLILSIKAWPITGKYGFKSRHPCALKELIRESFA